MKKIIILIAALFLTGCSNSVMNKGKDSLNVETQKTNKKENIAEGYRGEDNVWDIPVSGELMKDISDSKVVWDDVEIVALITIDSIEGGDNFNKVSNGYCFPYTYGKMTVQKVYKGEISVGEQLNYFRSGGTVTYDKYYDSLLPAEKEKIKAARAEGYIDEVEYVKIKMYDDIDIKVGTSYIAYLTPDIYYENKDNGYVICNAQGGFREVKGNPNARSEMQVFNNFSKEWENIEKIIIKE